MAMTPLPADYHMHTPLCRHASGEPTELAARAVKVGLSEIGFSEHNPMMRDDWDDWHMRQADLDDYVDKVEKARRDHPQLTIKLAMEVDFIPGHEDWIRDLAARHPWDYLIGAVHYVSDSWDLDNPKKLSEWKQRDPNDVWRAYFERLTMAAESGLISLRRWHWPAGQVTRTAAGSQKGGARSSRFDFSRCGHPVPLRQ